MDILVDTVRISGTRGIENLELQLDRVTLLIGQNNHGKTSCLKALQLAFGDYSRLLCEEDFHRTPDERRVDEIVVDIRIVPVGPGENRISSFIDDWAAEFTDTIQSDASGQQFVAIRTKAKLNPTKGTYEVFRYALDHWPDFDNWRIANIRQTRIASRFDGMPFYAIDAQRDLHQDLKERTSFVGRVLSSVEYAPADIEALEQQIKLVNDDAVEKSDKLQQLKIELENLNHSFQGAGVAEITPFPKKLRDLSKHFSVHFGDTPINSFPMEYHGMGTRSWASMLTVKSFVSLISRKFLDDYKPFAPLVAAEEPEAHLHPNAQRTLYRQLADCDHQVILSTHSPYLAAAAKFESLRSLQRSNGTIKVSRFDLAITPEAKRRLQREIIHSRGEILFSRAIVLCEGETEEQCLPVLFQNYFNNEAFVLGINFIGVGGSGKRYLPFFMLGRDFGIPVYVLSDGEPAARRDLKKYYEEVFGVVDIDNCDKITILNDTDFEGYLLASGYSNLLGDAIRSTDGDDAIENWKRRHQGEIIRRTVTAQPPCPECTQRIYADVCRDYAHVNGNDQAIGEILKAKKTQYSPVIATELCKLEPANYPPKFRGIYLRN